MLGRLSSLPARSKYFGALNTYCSSYYGCLAGWDLGGELANQFYNCWKTNVKLAWSVPRATRTYLVQQVLSWCYISARTDILARSVKFFQSLLVAPSHVVRTVALVVAWDMRTTTAKNLDRVRQETFRPAPSPVFRPVSVDAGLTANSRVPAFRSASQRFWPAASKTN